MSAPNPEQNPKRGLEQNDATEQNATKRLKTDSSASSSSSSSSSATDTATAATTSSSSSSSASSSSSSSTAVRQTWPPAPWSMPPGMRGYKWLSGQVSSARVDSFDSLKRVIEKGFFDAVAEDVYSIDFKTIRMYGSYNEEKAVVSEYFRLLAEYFLHVPNPKPYMGLAPIVHTHLSEQAFHWFVYKYSRSDMRSDLDNKAHAERVGDFLDKYGHYEDRNVIVEAFSRHPCLLVCDASITNDAMGLLSDLDPTDFKDGVIGSLASAWNEQIVTRWLPLVSETNRVDYERPMQIADFLARTTVEQKEERDLFPLTIRAKFLRDCVQLGFRDKRNMLTHPIMHRFFCDDRRILKIAARQFQHAEDNVGPFATPFFQYFLDHLDLYANSDLVNRETAKALYLNRGQPFDLRFNRNDPTEITNPWANGKSLVPIVLRELGVDFLGYEVFPPAIWKIVVVDHTKETDEANLLRFEQIDCFYWYAKAKIREQNEKALPVIAQTYNCIVARLNAMKPLAMIALGYLYGRNPSTPYLCDGYSAEKDWTANIIFEGQLFEASPLIERYNLDRKALEKFTFVVQGFDMNDVTEGENVFSDEEPED